MKKSNLGILFPNNEELDIYREYLNEAMERNGRSGNYYPVINTKVINTDVFYEWGSPTRISYFLIDRPKISLLNKFGWNVEDKTKRPIICYMSFLDSNYKNVEPSEGSLIELSVRENAHNPGTMDTRKFQVVQSDTDPEMNMFICNLAPYREQQKPAEPIPTQKDPANEDSYLVRKTIYGGTNENS